MGEDGPVSTSLDPALDLALRAAQEEAGPDAVGDFVESVVEAEGMRTHYFDSRSRGYRGWRWAVTVVELDGATTVSEVVLLPGDSSVLAPAWVPWQDRVRPGDLGPGDLYPTAPLDPRLEPGYTGADALEAVDGTDSDLTPLRPEQWELGLGRETVLSAYGRDLATERWAEGDFGPSAPMAKVAPATCGSCGFLLTIGGLVGQAFGVCAHDMGADGRVVALDYGCGAHSSVREVVGTGVPVTEMVVDELDYEVVAVDLVDESAAEDSGSRGEADEVVATETETDEVAVAEVEESIEVLDVDDDIVDDVDGSESSDSSDSPDSADGPESADSADEASSPDESDDDIVDIEPDEVLG